MLNQVSLEHYLIEIQQLTHQAAANERDRTDLITLIDRHLEEITEDSAQRWFLLGERAFYQKQYKIALKHYMKAKDVPHFHFFCYRTCAYLFDADRNRTKALEFIKKALAQQPNDWASTALCTALLATSEEQDNKTPAANDTLDHESPTSIALGVEEFDELSKLFQDEEEAPPQRDIMPLIPQLQTAELGQALERRIASFQEEQKRRLRDYIAQRHHKIPHQDYLFHVIEGWQDQHSTAHHSSAYSALEQRRQETAEGYFLKWRGKGIAINPGTNFLHTLHRQGLRIDDIDCVIVTREQHAILAEVKEIYDLNTLVNTAQEPLHIIHYYLSHPVHEMLGRSLKPHFKQERHTVHCLELYLDSPEVETVAIDDGMMLHYFATGKTEEMVTSIGIQLELTGPAQVASPHSHPIKVGYVSDTPWSPHLAEHLQGCDLLIVGIGETSPEDCAKQQYQENSLGYFGCLSLLEEVRPRLLLCCEFRGNEGDVRIEVIKKLRADFANHNTRPTTILPGNVGLKVDLTTLQIFCTASQSFIDPAQVYVARTNEGFGALHYLSPHCLI